jgi:hypothetical protein
VWEWFSFTTSREPSARRTWCRGVAWGPGTAWPLDSVTLHGWLTCILAVGLLESTFAWAVTVSSACRGVGGNARIGGQWTVDRGQWAVDLLGVRRGGGRWGDNRGDGAQHVTRAWGGGCTSLH